MVESGGLSSKRVWMVALSLTTIPSRVEQSIVERESMGKEGSGGASKPEREVGDNPVSSSVAWFVFGEQLQNKGSKNRRTKLVCTAFAFGVLEVVTLDSCYS